MLTNTEIMKEVMLRRRKDELELYKLHANDDAFRAAFYHSVQKALMTAETSAKM